MREFHAMVSSPPSTDKDLLGKLEVRVVVFSRRDNALQALLVHSLQSPAWELPGIPIQVDQSLESVARQCLGNPIELQETYLKQLYPYGHPHRDPMDRLVSVINLSIFPLILFI
jgi:ADP-ribose pyrophosphatase YjhB (NUDIX family)